MPDILELFLLGVFSGMISSFFGIGGGIIIIPTLNFVYPELDQQFVIATSLAAIFVNAIFNTLRFKKDFDLPVKRIALIILFSLIFAALAAKVATGIESAVLKLIFVGFITFIVLPMMFINKEKVHFLPQNKTISSILTGSISGTISGFTGLGGGAVNVPLLYQLLHVEFKLTSFYSNAIMIFTTLSGVITFMILDAETQRFDNIGYVLPWVAICIIAGTWFGSLFGKKMHAKFESKKLKLYFVILLIFIIIRTTYTSISSL